MLALLGRNPFREEVEDLKKKQKDVADSMSAFRDQYCVALEKWEQSNALLQESEATKEKVLKRLADSERRAARLEVLVENLRARIRDKDEEMAEAGRDFRARMERTKDGYQARIDEYNRKVDELGAELAARKAAPRRKRKEVSDGRRTGN